MILTQKDIEVILEVFPGLLNDEAGCPKCGKLIPQTGIEYSIYLSNNILCLCPEEKSAIKQ